MRHKHFNLYVPLSFLHMLLSLENPATPFTSNLLMNCLRGELTFMSAALVCGHLSLLQTHT